MDTAARRNTTSWLHFLDELETFVPLGQTYVILDGLRLPFATRCTSKQRIASATQAGRCLSVTG